MTEEASKLRGLEARVAALETKFNFLLQFMHRLTEREEEKKKATINKRQKEIYPALSMSKAAQTLPIPRRPAFHIPRPSRTEPRQFQPLPIPVPQLYTMLVKKKMITPVGQRTRIGPQPKDYNKDLTCEYHQGEVGHTVENCRVLRHRIQDLLDQGVLKFRIEGVINTIGAEKNDEVDITSTKIPWEPLFHELKKRGLLTIPRAPRASTEVGTCQYHPEARDHNLQGCEEFKKEVANLITKGLIRRRGEQPERDCMTIDQLRLSPYEKTNFQARMERIKEDFEEFCEKKKEELGKLTPATPMEMSKPDPVVIHYATKEKVVLQTASVSAVQSSEKVPSVVIQVPQPFPYQDSKRIPWNYGMKVISVITPFLPPGFSRVSARKTRQPEPSRSDPTRARRIKYSQEEGPRHISQARLGSALPRNPPNVFRDTFLRSLPDSQQVDLRARAHWKEDTSMHDVELSDRQEFIGASRNPDRKTALKRTKNTPVDSARGAISHKSKLGFPQIRNLAKIGSASFPTVPRTSKSDIGS
uniref:Uncharacterized protein n=1 Tax=Fagus sylvatica TaxID=28930 RepID=A0A2N9GBC2_FAGSY